MLPSKIATYFPSIYQINDHFPTFGQNDRAKYVNAFMNHLVSWNAATGRLTWAQAFVNLGEPKIPVA